MANKRSSGNVKDVIRYVLEEEAGDFQEWFTQGDGWDDDAVAKTLGIKVLSESAEENLLQLVWADKIDGYFWEILAYNCRSDHVFVGAVKAAVETGILKKSKMKLPAKEKKSILDAMREEE